MKILRLFFLQFTLFILTITFISIYVVSNAIKRIDSKFLNKFEVNVVLRNAEYKDSIFQIIDQKNKEFKELKIKNSVFLSKEDIWQKIQEDEQVSYILSTLSKNPFPDVIRIKLEKYNKNEFNSFISEIRNSEYASEVLYDESYLFYLEKIYYITDKYKIINEFIFVLFLLCVIYLSVIFVFSKKIDILQNIITFVIFSLNILLYTFLINKTKYGIIFDKYFIFWIIGVFVFIISVLNTCLFNLDKK